MILLRYGDFMNTSRILIAVVVIVILAGGAFWYFQNQKAGSTMEPSSNSDQSMEASMAPEMSASPEAMASGDAMMASDSGSTTEGGVKEFTVTGSSFKFEPNVLTVNKGDTVKITFKNTGGFHDLTIDGYNVHTKQIAAGATDTLEFTADKAGTFEYYCSVGNHRAMGMKGTLTVK